GPECKRLGSARNNAIAGALGSCSADGAPMPHWSTEKIRGRERFSFWRDAVCQAAFNVSIEPVQASHERFSASISANNAGALRLATSQSRGAYHLIRGRRQIESAPADHYSIFLQVRGQTVVHNGDDSVPIRPDDMAISDGRFAFSATITDHRQQVIAVMP